MTTTTTLITTSTGVYEVTASYDTVNAALAESAAIELLTTTGERATILTATVGAVKERKRRPVGFVAAEERYARQRTAAIEAAHDFPLEA